MHTWNKALAFDVGQRRTGVALAHQSVGIVQPQETIQHRSDKELAEAVRVLFMQHKPDVVIVGLPRLPSGDEGAQSAIVRASVSLWEIPGGIPLLYIDERYTSPRAGADTTDGDASAACALLSIFLDNPQIYLTNSKK